MRTYIPLRVLQSARNSTVVVMAIDFGVDMSLLL